MARWDESQTAIGEVTASFNPEWDDEGDEGFVAGVRDESEGEVYYYLVAGWENDGNHINCVRIDLNAHGWRDLSSLADKMANILDAQG